MSEIIVRHASRIDNQDQLLGRLTVRQKREAITLKEHMEDYDAVPRVEDYQKFLEFIGSERQFNRYSWYQQASL